MKLCYNYYYIIYPFVLRRRNTILRRVASTCMLIKELLKCYRVFPVLWSNPHARYILTNSHISDWIIISIAIHSVLPLSASRVSRVSRLLCYIVHNKSYYATTIMSYNFLYKIKLELGIGILEKSLKFWRNKMFIVDLCIILARGWNLCLTLFMFWWANLRFNLFAHRTCLFLYTQYLILIVHYLCEYQSR